MKNFEDLTEEEKQVIITFMLDFSKFLDFLIQQLIKYVFTPMLDLLSNLPLEELLKDE